MQRQMPYFCTVYSIIASMVLILVGCTPAGNVPTPYATRTLSAPGIAASPTIDLQTSEELYGSESGYTGDLGQSDLTAASLPSRGRSSPRGRRPNVLPLAVELPTCAHGRPHLEGHVWQA